MSEPRSHPARVAEAGSGPVEASLGHVLSGRPIIRHLVPAVVLAAALLWAPWPFGSVVPWAAAVVAVAGPLALVAGLFAGARVSSLAPVALPAAALVLLALVGVLQSVSWPAAVAGALSPEHVRLAREARAALDPGPAPTSERDSERAKERQAGGTPDGDTASVPLSLAPAVSRRTAILMASFAAALLAAALAGRQRQGRRLLAATLLVAALAQILYGAPRWFARSRTLWDVPIPGSDRLRGTFVNPNHFALLLEIALAVTFAWGWWALRRARREPSAERKIGRLAPPALVWLTLFVALVFSGSRAGLAAAVGATVVQGLAFALLGSGRRGRTAAGLGRGTVRRVLLWAAAVGVLLAVGVAAVLMTGGQAGVARFTINPGYDLAVGVRSAVYRSTLGLWRRFPWTGTGLGTFLEAFPLSDGPDLGLTWWHAHCDPLELLATTGVVGVLLLVVGAAALGLRLLRRLLEVRHSEERAALVAGLGALVAAGLHEMVDFGLTMPADALALVVVVGAAAAALEPRRRDHRAKDGDSNATGPGQTRSPETVLSVRR